MKKLLVILIIAMSVTAYSQDRRVMLFNELLKDTTITYETSSPGWLSVFLSTDTLYGVTKNATFEFKQAYDTLAATRVDGGFVNLTDTINSFRLIKAYTPGPDITNSFIFQKNDIDSTRVFMTIYWHKLY